MILERQETYAERHDFTMTEKYFYIEPEKARELISQISEMEPVKRGIDSHAYLIGEYAVLTTSRIKLRNIATRDDDLAYFDELIKTLIDLKEQGVAVVPILGYCFDPNSENGSGYIIQQRAKGEELYDDVVMKEFYVCKPYLAYLSSDADAEKYIISRTNLISKVPQNHFDKFVSDIIVLLNNDILIDFNGKSNFFYDSAVGFQFIDLDSHTDYKYGLSESKPNSKEIVPYYGFTPCHFAVGTKVLPNLALDEKAIATLCDSDLKQLASNNKIIFEKCKIALFNNGIPEEQLNNSLAIIEFYGDFK
ncbi:hypothetical protein FACS1894219_03900 [Clostridia bacterium]|nr:hypothetical protein FACS1894219_03900 [Clostridia bacterium]